MKIKYSHIRYVSTLIISIFILGNFQGISQGILTIQADNSTYEQQITYCPSYDSILLLPMDNSSSPIWEVNAGDSIFTHSIYIPNGFDGVISYLDFINPNSVYVVIKLTPMTEFRSNEDLTLSCENPTINLLAISSFVINGDISYNWTPSEGLDDPTIQNPTATVFGDIVYTAIISSSNGCTETQTHNITMDAQPKPEICIVSINEDNKNVIYYDKFSSTEIDSFYIFKETFVTNQYEKIGAIDFESDNIYVDSFSNPNIQSNKYKIQVRDNCSRVSEMSEAHKTLHLSINQGQNNVFNLIWEPYEGIEVATYYIYRGTNPAELELIGTSSSSNTQFSDFTAPDEYVYYQIEIVAAGNCGITKKSDSENGFLTSKSNIATNNSNPYGISGNSVDEKFSVYPNPAEGNLNIKLLNNIILDLRYEIVTSLGQKLIEGQIRSGFDLIDISELESGIYLLTIKSDSEILGHKTFIKK